MREARTSLTLRRASDRPGFGPAGEPSARSRKRRQASDEPNRALRTVLVEAGGLASHGEAGGARWSSPCPNRGSTSLNQALIEVQIKRRALIEVRRCRNDFLPILRHITIQASSARIFP
ncbi:hypothetical protein Acr_10g0003990 [Actinidia rufa]|uniref:Uncharacterized protein n=1 Tax=Actinidia rufa TaxID=165716 RepID=A0A7J0F8H3_9ERIC|nr:hypothetical protein Acr_10g0003990 [Actinidia rufa]